MSASIGSQSPIPSDAYRVVQGSAEKEAGKERTLSLANGIGNLSCTLIRENGSWFQNFKVAIGRVHKIAVMDAKGNLTNVAVTKDVFEKIFGKPKQETASTPNAPSASALQMHMLDSSKNEVLLLGKGIEVRGILDPKKNTITSKEGSREKIFDSQTGEQTRSRDFVQLGIGKYAYVEGKGKYSEGKLIQGTKTYRDTGITEKGTFDKEGKFTNGTRTTTNVKTEESLPDTDESEKSVKKITVTTTIETEEVENGEAKKPKKTESVVTNEIVEIPLDQPKTQEDQAKERAENNYFG
jgi:hypothetical protein